MAFIKAINPGKRSLSQGIKYISNPEKTEKGFLISGKDCDAQSVLDEMKATKELYGKTDGRQYKHFVQSFNREDQLSPSQAHQIGHEMAQKAFHGFEVLVATHTDKDHLHNHLIVNSVSFETGGKYQLDKRDLEEIKELSNQICEREGLHVMSKGEQIPGKALSMNEYQVALRSQSWKIITTNDIDKTLETCHDKEAFIKGMENKGYQVKWSDERKYITYTTPDNHKVRDNKLHDEKYSKEGMTNEFSRFKENQPGHGRSPERERTKDEILSDFFTSRQRQRELDAGGNNQPDRTNASQNGPERDGHSGAGKETSEKRDSQERTVSEGQQNSGGVTRRNEGTKSNELQKAGDDLGYSQRGIEKEPGKQLKNDSRGHGSSAPGENDSESKLDGKGEAIRNTTPDNSRPIDSTNRGILSVDPLDDAIKALGNSFEKVQKKEKFEGERIKQKIEQQSQNPRSKRSQEDELER